MFFGGNRVTNINYKGVTINTIDPYKKFHCSTVIVNKKQNLAFSNTICLHFLSIMCECMSALWNKLMDILVRFKITFERYDVLCGPIVIMLTVL